MKAFLALAAASFLAGCGFNTTVVSLDYEPGRGQNIPGPRIAGAGHFADMRQRGGEFTLGTVRSAIGTPLEKLTTRVPVASAVSSAFGYGLKARGMLAAAGAQKVVVSGEILDLECTQTLQPTAHVRLRVNLVRRQSGEIVFSQIFQATRKGATYAPGSGSPVPALVELTSRTLQNVVDQSLDDRELRRKLISASGDAL